MNKKQEKETTDQDQLHKDLDTDTVDTEETSKDQTEKSQEGDNELEKEIEELKDKYLRLFAEFENYKKRTIREKLDMMKTAAQDTLAAILPVLDDFDRAKKVSDDEEADETFSEGVSLVYNKLYSVLKHQGLKEMDSTGKPFDPEFHEAVTEIPAPSEDLKGKVVDTVEKGYMLKERIIRHAKVVVGK